MSTTNDHIKAVNVAVWEGLSKGYQLAEDLDAVHLKYAAIGGAVAPVIQRIGLNAGTVNAFAVLLKGEDPDVMEPLAVKGVNEEEPYIDPTEGTVVNPDQKLSTLIGLQSARHLELDDNIFLGIIDEDLDVSTRVSAIYTMVSEMAAEGVGYPQGSMAERLGALSKGILEELSGMEGKDFEELSPGFARIGTMCYLALCAITSDMRTVGMNVEGTKTGRLDTSKPNRSNAPKAGK